MMVEIRWHGRGGQGAVASAEILALAAIQEGKAAQAFPSFGPERRGAPVMAFTRIDDNYIYLRTSVTEPDIVVVLDPTVIAAVNVAQGLKDNGLLVINTYKSADEIFRDFGEKHPIAVVDATKISIEEIGRPITNTTMLGALARATGIVSLDSLEKQISKKFPSLADINIRAMRRAYDESVLKEQ